MADAPDDAIDRLYGLALEEFIPAREALSKELRDSGRRGEASAVKALKKPTVAAWAVNQAVRSQPRAARELWDAGDALAAAQEAVLSGKGSGADLREAAERERLAVDPLVDAAQGLLTSSGGDLSDTTIDRVRSTLQAAAIDADARDEVAAGRATRERAPRGLFGDDAGAAAAAPSSPSGTAKRGRSAAPEPGRSATRGRSTTRGRSARPGTEKKAARGRSAAADTARSRDDEASRGRSAAADTACSREEEAARKREEAAARKREREEKAARERARKAAAARVARAENALAAAEARSAKAAEQLEDARAREREAVEALADARAELRAHER
jgi:hypothetical protein